MFKTKAQNLQNLKKKYHINIPDLIYFKVSDYEKNKLFYLNKIKKHFTGLIAIRSSASNEDSNKISLAGYFATYLNIPSSNRDLVMKKIDLVIKSYKKKSSKNDEILIQKMVSEVKYSGVLLSRDINSYNPYYVINYHIGKDTSAVTSGKKNTRLIKYFFNKKYKLKKPFDNLIIIAKRIKKIFKCEIDIEFVIDKKNRIFIVQARKLNIKRSFENKYEYSHQFFSKILLGLEKKIIKLKKPHHNLLGDNNFFGVMPDWNPAEIIGKKPRPLALSLYRELITDHIWAENRKNYGFSNLRQFHLMTSFFGTPYIDVRIDFNSWLPKDLNKNIKKKLINFYLTKFKKNKNYHDKIEKEIIFSCYSFNTPEKINLEIKDILTKKEKKIFINSLKKINNFAYQEKKEDLDKIEKLKIKQIKIEKSNLYYIDKIYWHIEECKEYGTLPFAGLARCGFIAIELLNSMVNKNILSIKDKDTFLGSIKNISSKLIEDLKKLNKRNFLKKYGHLRPNTYEITSLNYAESFEKYFQNKSHKKTKLNLFKFSKGQIRDIKKFIKQSSFSGNFDNFISFIKNSIWAREYAKFVFSKSIDFIFKNLILFGKKLQLTRDELSYLDINDILNIYYNLTTNNLKINLHNKIKQNAKSYKIDEIIQLPDIIIDPKDIYLQDQNNDTPNFITSKTIKGEIIKLDMSKKSFNVKNKIVCIENADPGFDFIFTHKIKGLITKFGGFNSHMSIRCSEMNIPAAVGVGDDIYQSLSNKNTIELNCVEKKIKKL